MRTLTYYVACTVDGFIAREDGSFDFFLPEGEHLTDLFTAFPETVPGHLREMLGVSAPNREFDTVLMGRATYEVGLRIGVTSPYPHLRQYLFSRTMAESPDPAVTLVSGDALQAVRRLKSEHGQGIWLCGGAQLAAVLSTEIDELILKVNPTLLGAGIPLFAGTLSPIALDLIDTKTYGNGFMLVRYRMKRS
jgi:dihydrofolate reductase